jgi:hypothetical protein
MVGSSKQISLHQTDLWVVKFDQGGFLMWQQMFGAENGEANRDAEVVESTSGDLIILSNRDDDFQDSASFLDLELQFSASVPSGIV